MPKVTFKSDRPSENVTLEVKEGTTILDVALDNNIDLEHNCGGSCACTTCHVFIREGMGHLSEMEEDEEDRLDTAEGLTLSSRLGCQARVNGDILVEIPKRTQEFRKAEQH
ncbi:MAG: 2Fe-2S iron-sulfur cluster-binding protein [Nitrospira sp.]|nr:2Fe-2S iron-sulfur cluster binding domain-containing protein [Candidatus Manganitrophaceae bacterium]HIL35780.1 2Fe-2S iron-sulfur cluster binding domain-containing protein [Candidatus Manganitrophaceae bacterium]